MSKGNTSAPKCMVCGSNHWLRDPHIWKDEPTPRNIVQTLEKKVATITGNVQTIDDTPKNVRTIRKVSIRELGRGLSKQFSDLPFNVTKNGRVIASVR